MAPYWIGAGGAMLFVLVFLLDGWTRPGYSPVRHPVSALALGPRGWVQTSNFLVCGTAITAGAVGVATAGGSVLLGVALTVFGLALIASGIFPMDPMRGYPPGAPDGDPPRFTARHQWHDHAGAVVFLVLPVAAGIAAFALSDLIWQLLSAVVAVVLVAGFVAFGQAWEEDSPRTGLIQRAVIVPGWLWLAAVLLHFAHR